VSQARVGPDGILTFEGKRYRAVLGRGGVTANKREGDGATPAGSLPLRQVLYRADRVRRPRAGVQVVPLAPNDGWCDDPWSADYNRMVRLPHEARHEELWRRDAVYDVIGILGWNDDPVVPGRGSAIFLHVAPPNFAPTLGCIALLLPDLLSVLEAGLSGVQVDGVG
jgi:L,D-peptidoglycan transpeptidase YkuD (ErfK/YbiS/YcfS/YnhG family)